jgi:hypothetical protein
VDVGNITVEHIIFIPGVLLIGVTVGFLLGAKAVRSEVARMKERAKK